MLIYFICNPYHMPFFLNGAPNRNDNFLKLLLTFDMEIDYLKNQTNIQFELLFNYDEDEHMQ